MINLRTNYPSLPQEHALFQAFGLKHLDAGTLLKIPQVFLNGEEKKALACMLDLDSDLLTESQILTCTNGTGALYAVLKELRNEHAWIGVEDFTYTGLLTAAKELGYALFTIVCDAEGMMPGSLEMALQKGLRLLYLQPTIQNPTNRVMSRERRVEIASLLKQHDALIIEDDAYRFLHPSPPPGFLQLLPQHTIYIYSLSKPFHSFLQSCFIIYPQKRLLQIEERTQRTGINGSSLSRLFSFYLFEDNRLKTLIAEKQAAAAALQKGLAAVFRPFSYAAFPTSYHLWIKLPPGVDSIAVTHKLKERGILITGGHECSATADASFIRVALSAEKDMNKLKNAMETIRNVIAV